MSKNYIIKSRYYVPQWCRWLNGDNVNCLDPQNINGLNLFTYCNNNPVMYSDGSGHMPTWANWLIGGLCIVGAIALTIVTAGLGTAIASAIGTGIIASIAGGAIAGAAVGAVSGALISVGTQTIAQATSKLSAAESQLNSAFTPLRAIKSFSGMPFSGTNIARSVAQAATNYNNAYSAYIIAKGTYDFAYNCARIGYFAGENLLSDLIGMML